MLETVAVKNTKLYFKITLIQVGVTDHNCSKYLNLFRKKVKINPTMVNQMVKFIEIRFSFKKKKFILSIKLLKNQNFKLSIENNNLYATNQV